MPKLWKPRLLSAQTILIYNKSDCNRTLFQRSAPRDLIVLEHLIDVLTYLLTYRYENSDERAAGGDGSVGHIDRNVSDTRLPVLLHVGQMPYIYLYSTNM